jgi:hypothetical protein
MPTQIERMKLRLIALAFLCACIVAFPFMVLGALLSGIIYVFKKGPTIHDILGASYSLITGKE